MILLVDSSLFNAFGMEYINAGYRLNYSLSRGIGSLAYSVVTLIMGFAISRTSEDIIIPAFMIVQTVVFLALFMIRPAGRNQTRTYLHDSGNKKRAGDSIFTLLGQRPEILLLLCGILLMYLSYTAINNFHVNIISSVGGGSRELGISTSIAAFIELPAMALFLPLSKRFSFERLLRFSCFFFIVKAALMSLASSVHAVYAIQTLQLLSYGLFIPASTYYINAILNESDMAKGQTLLGIFTFGLSGLISSLLSGLILDRFSVHILLIIMTLLAIAGFIITVTALRRIRLLSGSH
jgi:PPP family 3-phenylpropionic acid transporter